MYYESVPQVFRGFQCLTLLVVAGMVLEGMGDVRKSADRRVIVFRNVIAKVYPTRANSVETGGQGAAVLNLVD